MRYILEPSASIPFRTLLIDGTLVATGSRRERSAKPALIYREGWRSINILNHVASTAKDLTGSKDIIYNIRVFPVIYAPDAAEHLTGCSLADVFRRCVLNDPELVASAKRIPDRDKYVAAITPEIQAAATSAELKCRGAGFACIITQLKLSVGR